MLLSLLSGTLKGYCGKITGGMTDGFKDAALANTIRMLMCVAVGIVIVLLSGSGLGLTVTALLICLLSGVSTSVFVVSWLVIVKKGAYMMLDVFIMLGTLVPVIFSTFLFGEGVGASKIVGIAVIFAAALIMCSYNNSTKERLTLRSFLLLIVCGAASGFSDLSQKLLVNFSSETPVSTFNLYTYVVSAAVLFLFFCLAKNGDAHSSGKNVKKALPYIAVMSAALFSASFFKTLAAKYLDSAILYPLCQGAGLILSSCMCAVFFGERLTKKCIAGLLTAGAGIVILNFCSF